MHKEKVQAQEEETLI